MKLKVLPIDRAAQGLSKTPLIALIGRLGGKIPATLTFNDVTIEGNSAMTTAIEAKAQRNNKSPVVVMSSNDDGDSSKREASNAADISSNDNNASSPHRPPPH
eukprot:scaffold43329_cov1205-Skeletonema_marinoi.AAC.1